MFSRFGTFYFSRQNAVCISSIGLAILFCLLPFSDALAQTCLSDPGYAVHQVAGNSILTSIITSIQAILQGVANNLYNGLIADTNYQAIVTAGTTLYIAIYGLMIMFNMVSATPGEAIMRILKVALVWAIATQGYAFFYFYFGRIFWDGMNELINTFNSISAQAIAGVPPANINTAFPVAPFQTLSGALGTVFSARFFLSILAMLLTGPIGWFYALVISSGIFFLLYTLLGAMTTYIKSLVGISFLFAIAPFFFIFLLFHKTRNLFDGWLHQLVSFALQPVMLFAFLSFYMFLIDAIIRQILEVDICWSKFLGSGGFPFELNFWRFKVWETYSVAVGPSVGKYEIVPEVSWGLTGPYLVNPTDPTLVVRAHQTDPRSFPVAMSDALFFLLLSSLAWRFSAYVGDIAREIAGGSVNITTTGQGVQQWFKQKGINPMNLAKKGGEAALGAGTAAVGALSGFMRPAIASGAQGDEQAYANMASNNVTRKNIADSSGYNQMSAGDRQRQLLAFQKEVFKLNAKKSTGSKLSHSETTRRNELNAHISTLSNMAINDKGDMSITKSGESQGVKNLRAMQMERFREAAAGKTPQELNTTLRRNVAEMKTLSSQAKASPLTKADAERLTQLTLQTSAIKETLRSKKNPNQKGPKNTP